MVSSKLRIVLSLFIFTFVLPTSSCQKCKEYTFPDKKVFTNCSDLPQLSSFLHYTYTQASGNFDIAYRRSRINLTNRWAAWAINPKNNLIEAMVGAQAFVAISQSNGALRVYTSSIDNYNTQLEEGSISYNYTGLKGTYENNEVIIYATLTLPSGTQSLVHLWQDGPNSDSLPDMHDMDSSNLNSKQVLDLV